MKNTFRIAILVILIFVTQGILAAGAIDLWFPPGWKSKATKAKSITKELSTQSGLTIRPRIANSYPQILKAFSGDNASFVYVGSFVQAIIRDRGLGKGLVQAANGKEFYSGVLVYPKGEDPSAILSYTPSKIAFAVGASSGESSAKAATGGQASIATKNHGATCGAVKVGKAKAGVVKNWWWESNGKKFPQLEMYEIPGVSENKNPDNVLAASKAVPDEVIAKVIEAAKASKKVFGANEVVDFDPSTLDFSLSLMEMGKIDPKTYSW